MKLFHYTALHHAERIRRDGCIKGSGIPLPSADGQSIAGTVPGVQWLTTDPDWDQSWATRETISCDRTECRLVIEIPLLEQPDLRRWDHVAADFGYTGELAERFARIGERASGGSGSQHWYVFPGPIPYAWVTAVERHPGLHQPQSHELAHGAEGHAR